LNSIFKTIKKKRNKRRLCGLWLFLVVMELFCPAICNDQVFAAEFPSEAIEVRISNKNENDSNKTAVSTSDSQNQDQHETFCSGDCLCHGTGILSLPFTFQKSILARSERSTFLISDPIIKSLPPPYRPPKNF